MADLLNQKVKFLRNANPFLNYESALSKIKEQLAKDTVTDGEIVLASYLEPYPTEEGIVSKVRTLLGVKRNVQGEIGYEIFDNKAANDAINALDANKTGTDNHVTVNVVQVDGKVDSVTVTTEDIASAALLGTKEDDKTKETAFGYIAKEVADRISAINSLDATVSSDTTNVNVSITETDGKLTGLTVSEDYATVTRTETSSSAGTPATNASINVTTGDEGKLIKASDLAKVAAYAADKATEEMHRVDKKIADLSATKTGSVDYTTVKVDTAAGNVSGVTVTQKIQSVSNADSTVTDKKGLAEASDVKAYVDSKSAAASTTVKQGAGITVTESGKEDGHVEYQVASNLVFAYNAASGGSAATITLKSAVREGEEQVTYGTVNVSDIIGNGMLQSGSYNHETGMLTLVFNTASGETQSIDINLASLLDIDDMIVGTDSQKYFEVKTVAGEGDVHNFQLDVKIKNVEEATADVTGLADAFEVKTYVDKKASDLAISAQGDNYITAAVDGSNNKKININADVQNVEGSKGTVGSYDTEGAQTTAPTHGTLAGVANALVDSAQSMAKVKDYVDGEVAIEAARADAKVLASIKALDKNDSAVAKSFVTAVSETDGIITVSRGRVTSTTKTVTLADNEDGGINLGVNVDDASIKISDVDGHVGQLTVGTIDCGTY